MACPSTSPALLIAMAFVYPKPAGGASRWKPLLSKMNWLPALEPSLALSTIVPAAFSPTTSVWGSPAGTPRTTGCPLRQLTTSVVPPSLNEPVNSPLPFVAVRNPWRRDARQAAATKSGRAARICV